jgi:hexosaminidase
MCRNFFILGIALIFLISCQKKSTNTDLASMPIIPKPISVVSSDDVFELKTTTKIYVKAGTKEWGAVAEKLAAKLRMSTNFEFIVEEVSDNPTSGIYFASGGSAELGEEGYELGITKEMVKITSHQPAGAFRAIQTILQLLPAKIELTAQQGPWEIATGTIKDFPSYSYRGVMLDVARHFFSVEEVKLYIDQIALYKINYLHLHLSDDQGWRIEIKSWPNLTLHGGKTEVGGGAGGFYTQEQYTELINYAQARYITIVPEIDMPGHINSALASYGELNGGTIVPVEGRVTIQTSVDNILDGKTRPTELYTGTEVGWSTLRIEKEETFKFVEDVVRELSAITPGPYFHVGGDEASVTKKEDYIAFINRFQEIVKANGKRMIGWEEIAQGNINQEAITQHWNLSKYALMAIEKNSMLIMSPAKKAYLDMSYDSTSKLGLHWAAYIEVDSAYNWNPATLVNGISKENILGIEAPLWSETISNSDEIEYLTFPRLLGYAEIGWSSDTNRSWDEYKIRLGKHAPRMKAMGIDFYRSKLVAWIE